MLPFHTQLLYKPFYCEENVWHLASNEYFADEPDCKVVFITNRHRQCWFWHQRNAPPDRAICWDYHVVLLARKQIWDLDTLMPFPCAAQQYLDETFMHVGKMIEPDRDPLFRLVERSIFIREFASDRSHMLDAEGKWMAPPPDWPPIGMREQNNLQRFIDIDDATFGAVITLGEFRAASALC